MPFSGACFRERRAAPVTRESYVGVLQGVKVDGATIPVEARRRYEPRDPCNTAHSMRESIETFVRNFPEPLAVMLLATLPVFELRGAIPFALGVLDLPVWQSYVWAVLGNLLPVPFILMLLGPVTAWAEDHWAGLHRFLERLFSHTRRRHTTRFDRWRDLALITFVAIPLPITGAWSGALAAFVFGVERRKAFALIAIGVSIAGIVVTMLWQGGSSLLSAP